jgi:glutathione S-transferase
VEDAMIEFHAGTGADSHAVGIALEEGFFDYRIVDAGDLPMLVDQERRIGGAGNILMHLAQRAGWPNYVDAAPWLKWSGDMPELDLALAASPFILGGAFSIADMAVWPHIARDRAKFTSCPNIARWADRMSRRAAAGRGFGAILAAGR